MASEEPDRTEKRRQEILKQTGFDEESLRKSLESRTWFYWIGLVFAVFTTIAAFYFTLSSDVLRSHAIKNGDVMLTLERQQEQINELKNLVKQMPTNSFAATNMASLQIAQSLSDHEKRLKIIEDVILENPEKAIALPLIRQDQKMLDESLVSLKHEVEQSSETLRWAFGLILTSALTIAGIFASIIFRSRKEEADLRLKALTKKGD